MINLAGDLQCDKYIKLELEEAGIGYTESKSAFDQEVPSAIIAHLYGWTFKRAWYYWVAKADDGVCLPFDLAEELYERDKTIRVAGHCGALAPREWYRESYHVGVSLYHVDTQVGLNLLAQYIARHTASSKIERKERLYDPIKVRAAELRQQLQGGKVYGRNINWDDLDCVLVAGYEAGYGNGISWHCDLIARRDEVLTSLEG